ncbi:MAG: conserved hypothetical protein [Marine Group I thaumarchaeote]|nr:MAG: conserved hypothetical protein [Marine Group I thaumarchaeote]
MHQYVTSLQNIVSRKRSGKILTFNMPHVFMALQLLARDNHVSRATLCQELHLGEGSVRTLILHLKDTGLVSTSKAGTILTRKGSHFAKKFLDIISAECSVKKCKIVQARYNHAIILKKYAKAISTGVQQRDFAIVYGATAATTLIYKQNEFVFPGNNIDYLNNDHKTRKNLLDNLKPDNGDAIIVTSADDPFVAEISAKNSALLTVASHEKH